MDSAIARFCESRAGVLYTRAGPEIGVASTKAFVTQLVCLHMLALVLANQRQTISPENLKAEMVDLARIPREMEEILKSEDAIQEIAQRYYQMTICFISVAVPSSYRLRGCFKTKRDFLCTR